MPFDMGRPFGSPNQPEFQISVLKEVLKLLERDHGPVLEDFSEDAPDMVDQPVQVLQMVCPVSFASNKEQLSAKELLLESFTEEFSQMETWYRVALKKNVRTTTGASGLAPEKVKDLLTNFIENEGSVETGSDLPLADILRLTAEDVKALYFEAVSAQPGQPN